MAELTTEEASVPLRVLVNLVPVRVIVRDANGNAVATLHKEDFQLYQDGKPQLISNFSVETPCVRRSCGGCDERRAGSFRSARRTCRSGFSGSISIRRPPLR